LSYDFAIATRTRPKADAIEVFGRALDDELHLVGAFKPDSNVLITFGDRDGRTLDVDGPSNVEIEDLPDELAGVVPNAKWLVEVHLPAGSEPGTDALALDLAIHLAREGNGAVFDPQTGRIRWPSGVTPRPRRSTEDRIRVVELDWIIPASAMPADGASRWLGLTTSRLPACAPVRFGSYEPMQGRLDRDGADGFAAAWAEQEAIPRGGRLWWSARRGGLGGGASFADSREEFRPARLGRVCRISASVDARPIHRDPANCDALVDFVATVAEDFGASYAAGSVTRDVILRRGRASWDGRSESGPLPRASWWVGLPALSTWLAWFGEPYRDRVAAAVAPWIVRQGPNGALARFGAEPMDMDELRGVFPALPPELLARRRDGSIVDPTVRVTLMHGPPSEPAEEIPWID
jgi:hypothetical protein